MRPVAAFFAIAFINSRIAAAEDDVPEPEPVNPSTKEGPVATEEPADGHEGSTQAPQAPKCVVSQPNGTGYDLAFPQAATALKLSGTDWQVTCDAASTMSATATRQRVVVPVPRCVGVGDDALAYLRSRAKQEFDGTELKAGRVELLTSPDKDGWKTAVQYVQVTDAGTIVGTFATRHSRNGCAADILIVTKARNESDARTLGERLASSFTLTFDAPHPSASTEARALFRCAEESTADRPYCAGLDRFEKLSAAYVAKPERTLGRSFRPSSTGAFVERVAYVDIQQTGASLGTIVPATNDDEATHKNFLEELKKGKKNAENHKLSLQLALAQIAPLPLVSATKDGTVLRTRDGFAFIRGNNEEFVALEFNGVGKVLGIVTIPRATAPSPAALP